ncbi:hypothetical protein BpHYR1_011213 [Brachionus plicatilis]|uniref:Uncharacterized protein n=1 Tax=Brachionus plicatilis TaxID=10195 RepID=A0A3M7SNT6_BRAPC|nr:hypothetical protein BpHYR1_011213 [Brachionus plicatilis]
MNQFFLYLIGLINLDLLIFKLDENLINVLKNKFLRYLISINMIVSAQTFPNDYSKYLFIN